MSNHQQERLKVQKEALSFLLNRLARQCERFANELVVSDKPIDDSSLGDGLVLSRVGRLMKTAVDFSCLMDSMIPDPPRNRPAVDDCDKE